jgi:hypothetical protein
MLLAGRAECSQPGGEGFAGWEGASAVNDNVDPRLLWPGS